MSRKVQIVGVDLKRRAPYVAHILTAFRRRRLTPTDRQENADYVFCLGAEAFQAVTFLRLPLHDVRGKVHRSHDDKLAGVTFHPRMIVKNRRLEKLFQEDLDSFADLIKFDLGGTL